MAANRTALGRDFSFSERSYGWLSADAVEVDEVDGYDVQRRRVLLDEVLLVTLHRARRVPLLVLWFCLWALIAWPILLVRSNSGASIWFLLASSPFALFFIGHAILGTDYVTVFGRRSRARVAFNVRKRRARQVYELLVAETEAAQTRHAPPTQPAEPAAAAEEGAPPAPRGVASG